VNVSPAAIWAFPARPRIVAGALGRLRSTPPSSTGTDSMNRRFALSIIAAGLSGCVQTPPPTAAQVSLQRIQHIVVIYAENHSFDNLYGLFPGADGIANATATQRTQLDHDGRPLKELVVFGNDGKPDAKFPRRSEEH